MKKLCLSGLIVLGVLVSTITVSAQITSDYLIQQEKARLDAVYSYYMANGGSLIRRTSLLYLYSNQTPTYTPTTAIPYFQTAYFGNLLDRPDFREQVEKVDQFWKQVLAQYPGRELQLEGSGAPLGGAPDRLSKIVWLNGDTLTVRIGQGSAQSTNSTQISQTTQTSGQSTYSPTQISSFLNSIRNSLNQALNSVYSTNSYTQVSSGATTGTGSTQTQTTSSANTSSSASLQTQVNQLLSIVQSLLAQLSQTNAGTNSSGSTTGSAGLGTSTTTTGPTPGTGSGNCSIVGTPLADGMTVIATVGNLNNAVPVTDDKVTAGASIYMFSPLVEQYDGWAKVNVNGVDYPVAGPGTSPIAGQPYSTSGQNHTALNRFDIVVPNLSVPDGSNLTIKLYRMNGDQTPYEVKKTFKYYSSLTPPVSDPYILPNANLGQNYSATLTAKCGGSVTWQGPIILSGILPRAFDIDFSKNSLVYNPIGSYVTPQVGDVGTFFLRGKSGGNDVVQKFSMRVMSPSSSTNSGGTSATGNSGQIQTGFPTVTSITPNYSNIVGLYAGKTITINGQGFTGGSARVDFYQGTAYKGSALNISVANASTITAQVPVSLGVGAYTVQVTIGNTVATSIDPSIRTFTITP